jgi:hypothetical protein
VPAFACIVVGRERLIIAKRKSRIWNSDNNRKRSASLTLAVLTMTGYGHHGFRISGIADLAAKAMSRELGHVKFLYLIIVLIFRASPE